MQESTAYCPREGHRSDERGNAAARRRARQIEPPPNSPPPLDLLSRLRIDANGFTFDPVTGFSYTMSQTGVAVIRWWLEGAGMEDTAKRLAESNCIAPERARLDLMRFTAELRRLSEPGKPRSRRMSGHEGGRR